MKNEAVSAAPLGSQRVITYSGTAIPINDNPFSIIQSPLIYCVKHSARSNKTIHLLLMRSLWQRRFWEHQLMNEADFVRPVESIHYNPVSHGFVKAPKDWAYSSFHRAVRWGVYVEDWGAEGKCVY